MRTEARKFLEDMREAAESIVEFTAGKTLDDYYADKLLRSGVERQFEIAGEALSQLNKVDPATAQRITEYRNIISFRNVLIHGYTAVNHSTTWDIVQNDLPILRKDVDSLLASAASS